MTPKNLLLWHLSKYVLLHVFQYWSLNILAVMFSFFSKYLHFLLACRARKPARRILTFLARLDESDKFCHGITWNAQGKHYQQSFYFTLLLLIDLTIIG